MANWESDDFMREWDKLYVTTNLKPSAKPYSTDVFLDYNDQLCQGSSDLKAISYSIIVSLDIEQFPYPRRSCCKTRSPFDVLWLIFPSSIPQKAAACSAVGRADVVGKFFDDITAGSSPEESQHIFLQLREAMTCIYPFLGMPSLVPGCFGMIGVLQRKGEQYASLRQFRKPTIDEENIRKGLELRKKIYASAGNSEILTLLGKYFADLCEWISKLWSASHTCLGPEFSFQFRGSNVLPIGRDLCNARPN